jgi:lysine 2,3-aminomutase
LFVSSLRPVRKSLHSLDDLVEAGLVTVDAAASLRPVTDHYAIAVTDAMVSLIDRNDPQDPIALQFIPDARELIVTPDELSDPIGDHAHEPVAGLVHRYPDRALLKFVHVCPVYCRFCFRREMVGPGKGDMMSETELDRAFAYLAEHSEIRELIITGGDPLILSTRRLGDLAARLEHVASVKLVRWHSRVPVVDPMRVTEELASALAPLGKSSWLAVHANHPREITDVARLALRRLSEAGVNLVSQSVLLRGVNDTAETLAELMQAFLEAGVKPYYLHHADLAPGTSHWRVSIEEGLALVQSLRGRLSGLAQPHYVIDIPGGFGKLPVHSAEIQPDGRYVLKDWQGRLHIYPPHMQSDRDS